MKKTMFIHSTIVHSMYNITIGTHCYYLCFYSFIFTGIYIEIIEYNDTSSSQRMKNRNIQELLRRQRRKRKYFRIFRIFYIIEILLFNIYILYIYIINELDTNSYIT